MVTQLGTRTSDPYTLVIPKDCSLKSMVQYDINKQILFMPSPCKGSELAIKNLLEKAEFFFSKILQYDSNELERGPPPKFLESKAEEFWINKSAIPIK